eukprot:2844992-Rhodomonas_salina.5
MQCNAMQCNAMQCNAMQCGLTRGAEAAGAPQHKASFSWAAPKAKPAQVRGPCPRIHAQTALTKLATDPSYEASLKP